MFQFFDQIKHLFIFEMDYMNMLLMLYTALPYLLFAFAFVTLIPKSVRRIRATAQANIESNLYKYHRCYGPELCCHLAAESFPSDSLVRKPTEKPRKTTLRRNYTKNQSNEISSIINKYSKYTTNHSSNNNTKNNNNHSNHNNNNHSNDIHKSISAFEENEEDRLDLIKRQVQPSAIQTQTNVNQMAKMFESGISASVINVNIAPSLLGVKRITPTQTPVMSPKRAQNCLTNQNGPGQVPSAPLKVHNEDYENLQYAKRSINNKNQQLNTNSNKTHDSSKPLNNNKINYINNLMQDYLENSMNLLNQPDYIANLELQLKESYQSDDFDVTSSAMPVISDSSTSSTASPDILTSSPISTPPLSPTNLPSLDPALLLINSNIDDLFAAIASSAEHEPDFDSSLYRGCKSLSPVTSIDDILAERRLSRPLSAYSISDLLIDDAKPIANDSFC